MNSDEILVGTIAIVLAVICGAIAIGPWDQPYRLRSFAAISRRFGKRAARGLWLAIAVAALTAGVAILTGSRPGYARPAGPADTLSR